MKIRGQKIAAFLVCLSMVLSVTLGFHVKAEESGKAELGHPAAAVEGTDGQLDKSNEIDQSVQDTELADESLDGVQKENGERVLESVNPEKDTHVTTVDENGNVSEGNTESGLVEEDKDALYTKSGEGKLVNFNTRGSAVTNYTEYGTGISGYTNGAYGADAAYLGTVNGKVKFMLAGVMGLADAGQVQVVNMSSAASVSYYAVSGGRLYHYITTNMAKTGYSSTLDNGPAPDYLAEGIRYYSYDGHYFYTRDNISNMIDNYNAGNRANAINSSRPFYNYYQYLPVRSKTGYTAEQLNNAISVNANSSSSKMLNTGEAFIRNQNTYGVNALLAVGVAANESWWGKSSIAQNKNNLFGLNAVDASPGTSADIYDSVDSCIKTFSETYMSKQYLNPNNYVYAGGFLGNKASGMNVMYASDPYWGEKNAGIAWSIDRKIGSSDAGKYTIAIKDLIGTEHSNLNVRKEASTSSAVIHTTKSYSNQAFIVLDKNINNRFYKVQSDAALNSSRTAVSGSGNYDYNNMYVYVSADYVKTISEGSGGNNQTADPVAVPQELKNALVYSAHVQNIGWMQQASNGHAIGTIGRDLPMEALKINTQGIPGLGIRYSAHVQDIGWQGFAADGSVSGTVGQAKKIEAVRMELTGTAAENYDIYYRAYVQGFGWLDWAKDGELSGTQGYNFSLQALQMVLLPVGANEPGSRLIPFKINTAIVEYASHVQDIGWQSSVRNGEVSGTIGKNKKVEGFAVSMKSGASLGVKYRAYVQNEGWQKYIYDGNIAGTVGQNLMMEAIQVELTGSDAGRYDIYYRAHVQDKGWLDWAKNGQEAGTKNFGLKMEAFQIVIMPKGNPQIGPTENPYEVNASSITYSAHVEDIGWQGYVKDGALAGTTGRNLQVEGLRMRLKNQQYTGSIEYSSHVENIGWQDYVSNGKVSGTVGNNLQIEAVKMRLTGEMEKHYDIYYRVHASEFGWLGWAKNGEPAGSQRYARHVEALEVLLVDKGGQAPGSTEHAFYEKPTSVKYAAHVQDIGWQDYVNDGASAGTVGRNKQVEAVRIQFESPEYTGDIEYRAHVEDIGWQEYVKNGQLAGTVGTNKQIEAVRLKLTGEMEKHYDIYYRVHASEFGWLGWARNGERAGSEGFARQVEAIEIKLVEKGGAAPGSTENSFYLQ